MGRHSGFISLELQPAKDPAACSAAGSQMDVGACSDIGRIRGNNEDYFLTAPEMNLHVLSDGMGGMASGEIASRLTVETIRTHCLEASANPSLAFVGKRIAGISEVSNRLASGIQLANQIVHKSARETADHRKMGATVVAVQCMDGRMSIAHVGDSRAYRLRRGYLELLTRDHSFLAELRQPCPSEHESSSSNLHHLLTRAVGVEPGVEVDVRDELFMENDTVLLCSDGLTRELSDSEITGVLHDAGHAQEAADQLVALANEAGGRDNITAIVIRYASKESGRTISASRLAKWFCGRRN
jgi:serine/threonine protein phosphatase PrpC